MKWLLCLSACLSCASAQAWTVQTVALKDYQEALARSEQLREFRFDAFVDFAMSGGQQYVRVRAGCFASRDGAQQLADFLAGRVTAEAVAVPLEPGDQPLYCWQRDVGFTLDGNWEQLDSTAGVTFRVELNGHEKFLHFDGAVWRLAQDAAELASLQAGTLNASEGTARFSEQTVLGSGITVFEGFSGEAFVSAGQLLWQQGDTAIVIEGDTVTAYSRFGDD